MKNEITDGVAPASFEPSIDYVVTKIPRFDFAKFKQSNNHLNTQMRSVGEAMAISRTFKESLNKALRSLENDQDGLKHAYSSILFIRSCIYTTRVYQAMRGLWQTFTTSRQYSICVGQR